MASVQRIGDLEIRVDKKWQQRKWKVERIGWLLMLILVIAGLLGLLGGPGVFSNTTIDDEDVTIRYNRFVHLLEETSLQVHATPVEGEDTIRVWISTKFLEDMRLEGIVPEPESVEVTSDQLRFSFRLGTPSEEVAITFYLNPTQPGSKSGQIGVDGGSSVELSLFVYP